jgi:hypothetical protein
MVKYITRHPRWGNLYPCAKVEALFVRLGFGKAVNGGESLFDDLPKRIFGFYINHRILLGLLVFRRVAVLSV